MLYDILQRSAGSLIESLAAADAAASMRINLAIVAMIVIAITLARTRAASSEGSKLSKRMLRNADIVDTKLMRLLANSYRATTKFASIAIIVSLTALNLSVTMLQPASLRYRMLGAHSERAQVVSELKDVTPIKIEDRITGIGSRRYSFEIDGMKKPFEVDVNIWRNRVASVSSRDVDAALSAVMAQERFEFIIDAKYDASNKTMTFRYRCTCGAIRDFSISNVSQDF